MCYIIFFRRIACHCTALPVRMRRPTDPRGPAREGRTGGIPVRAYRSGWAGVVSAGLPPTVRAPLVHGV